MRERRNSLSNDSIISNGKQRQDLIMALRTCRHINIQYMSFSFDFT